MLSDFAPLIRGLRLKSFNVNEYTLFRSDFAPLIRGLRLFAHFVGLHQQRFVGFCPADKGIETPDRTILSGLLCVGFCPADKGIETSMP